MRKKPFHSFEIAALRHEMERAGRRVADRGPIVEREGGDAVANALQDRSICFGIARVGRDWKAPAIDRQRIRA